MGVIVGSGRAAPASAAPGKSQAAAGSPGLPALWSREWLAFVWSSLPGLALAAAAARGAISESLALGLFAVSFVGLNLMHMGATWARVYVRPGWRVNPLERLAVPCGLAAFAISFEAVGGGALLLAAQYFISFHHALMQNYGIARAAQRRDGRRLDGRLDLAACLLLPGAALLYRASAVCGLYNDAPVPAVPMLVIQALAAAGVAALGLYAWREWRAMRHGERVNPIGLGLFFGTNLIWSALLIADAHPAIPLFALASGHYLQYVYFVRRVEVRDRPAGAHHPLRARLQTALRGSPLQYAVALLVIAVPVTVLLTLVSIGLRELALSAGLRPDTALAMPPWAAAMLGVNLEHYWLDRRIWRSPKPVAA
ncbi:MAG: hypothetical protein SF182_08695 [Deltaproteobacteria bacterium]|nr:hypothetical protein [Deltaproteobacteria bacterium]